MSPIYACVLRMESFHGPMFKRIIVIETEVPTSVYLQKPASAFYREPINPVSSLAVPSSSIYLTKKFYTVLYLFMTQCDQTDKIQFARYVIDSCVNCLLTVPS